MSRVRRDAWRARAFALLAVTLTITAQGAAEGAGTGEVATMTVERDIVKWTPLVEHRRLVLVVSGVGALMRREFESGENPYLAIEGPRGRRLPDGGYDYELRLVPKVDPETRKLQSSAQETGQREALAQRLRVSLPSVMVQSGHIVVHGGSFAVPGSEEELEPSRRAEIEGGADLPFEGREDWNSYRGSSATVAGKAVVDLPASFAERTESAGLTVQLTPIGSWSRLYVVEKSPARLVVRSYGKKRQQFDFLVQGVRRKEAGHGSAQPGERGKKGGR